MSKITYDKSELEYLSEQILPFMFDESVLEDSCPANKPCNFQSASINLAGIETPSVGQRETPPHSHLTSELS